MFLSDLPLLSRPDDAEVLAPSLRALVGVDRLLLSRLVDAEAAGPSLCVLVGVDLDEVDLGGKGNTEAWPLSPCVLDGSLFPSTLARCSFRQLSNRDSLLSLKRRCSRL